MTRTDGLIARFRSLVHGIFSHWVREGEQNNPAAVYQQAIDERTRQYRELKEAVAGVLYMRNKLEAEIGERRGNIARLSDDIRRAVRRGEDEPSLHSYTRLPSRLITACPYLLRGLSTYFLRSL